jgi:hypothetical protein
MIERHSETILVSHQRRFRWETLLPKRQAWIKSLVLLPLGLPIANFLGSSFNLARDLFAHENNYLLGIIVILFSLLIPPIFFAFCFHWCWLMWRQQSPTWYPRSSGLWAGIYATIAIALSFGIVSVVTNTFNICDTHSLGTIGQTLLCNLDRNYGFEPKSWFGVWFILAAYIYQAERWIKLRCWRLFRRRTTTIQQVEIEVAKSTSTGEVMTSGGEG